LQPKQACADVMKLLIATPEIAVWLDMWLQVGALQLHYLVVNRSSRYVPPPSPVFVPLSAIEESCGMPPKRKRGRPPRRHALVADCAREAHQQRHGLVFDESKKEAPSVSRKHSAEEPTRPQPAGLLPPSSSDSETSVALVCPPAKIPCRHVEQSMREDTADGGGDAIVESRQGDYDASLTVGCTSTCLTVDQRLCNDAVDDARSDSRLSLYPNQPMIWVNPVFNSVLSTGGLVCPFDTLDSSVFPSIQLVGLLATPFASDGAKTDGDVSYGAAVGMTGDYSQVFYPGFYGCLVSQEGDLSHAVSEGNPVCSITDFTNETSSSETVAMKTDRASHWRVRHETVEMQHFQALVSDSTQQLSVISVRRKTIVTSALWILQTR
jgi:hypothetical protein